MALLQPLREQLVRCRVRLVREQLEEHLDQLVGVTPLLEQVDALARRERDVQPLNVPLPLTPDGFHHHPRPAARAHQGKGGVGFPRVVGVVHAPGEVRCRGLRAITGKLSA